MQASRDGLPSCVAPQRHSGGVCREDSLVRIALEAPSEDGSGVLASTPSGSLYVDASSPSASARQHCERASLAQALLSRIAPQHTFAILFLFCDVRMEPFDILTVTCSLHSVASACNSLFLEKGCTAIACQHDVGDCA